MQKEDPKSDYIPRWTEFQKNFFDQWTDSLRKANSPWMDIPNFWTGMSMPFAEASSIPKRKEDTTRDAEEKSDGKTAPGPDAFFRMLNAGNLFFELNEFWMEVLKDLPALSRDRIDDVESREVFDRWSKRYKRIFQQLAGPPLSKTAEEMMSSGLNTFQMHQASLGLMLNPWLLAMPKWREQYEKLLKGDVDAVHDAVSLWREVYDESLGKLFRMPAFGVTKAHTERVRKSCDAFMQFGYSLPDFYEYLSKTSMEALREVFKKVTSLKFEEVSPDTIRQIYQIWSTTNENAFYELFKSPEFSNAMSEALNHGLILKKRLDELTADWCKNLSIPTIQEYDELSLAVHELRRKLRLQEKTIEMLQQQIAKQMSITRLQ